MKCSHKRRLIVAIFVACALLSGVVRAAVVQSQRQVLVAPRISTGPEDYRLDINADGIFDLTISNWALFHAGMILGPSSSSAGGTNGAQVATWSTGAPTTAVKSFGPGQAVGTDSTFASHGAVSVNSPSGTYPWGSADAPHFLGLRFPLRGEYHYGWVQLHHDPIGGYREGGLPNPGGLYIQAIAYETQPNTPIATVPESGVPLLALAALLTAHGHRRRR